MNAINEEPERHEIEALLPWHAAGTLSRRDANRVEHALAGDRELARQSELIREELVETIHLNERLRAPSTHAIEGFHPEKTRLIEFGRFAVERRAHRRLEKPETFNFLGFTFICGTSSGGQTGVLPAKSFQKNLPNLQT